MNIPNQPSPNQNIQFPQSVAETGSVIGNTLNSLTDTIKSTIGDFSQPADGNAGAGQPFLQSNTIIAKFAFLILIIIVFIFVLNLGISLLSKWFEPSENPYLINGRIAGNNAMVIKQDPNDEDSILVKRSNNQNTGLEFTWSSWIYIKELPSDNSYHHIFNKGNKEFIPGSDINIGSGIASINNCPGLYLTKSTDNDSHTATLHLVVNTSGTTSGSVGEETMNITDIPIKNWINVIIRCKNTMIDVYINGTIADRLNLSGAPIQNFNDVNVCQNGGFNGSLSALLYYSKAIDIFKINKIVSDGPLLDAPSTDTDDLPKSFGFLSNKWYSNKM